MGVSNVNTAILAKKRVLLAEITSAPGLTFSLASAYMQAYCQAIPCVFEYYRFSRLVCYAGRGLLDIIEKFVADAAANGRPDVLALTIYFWNRKVTHELVLALKKQWPDLIIVIGGNDIEHEANEIFAAEPNIDFICVGEGEQVFADLLSDLAYPSEDLTGSTKFRYAKGQINPLDQIPSPFLCGVILPSEIAAAGMIIYETNRGCPFKCSFCYWGGATGSKVRRFGEDRIHDEVRFLLRYISDGATLFLADANFGMHQQDITFARLLGSEARAAGKRPLLFVNWAKNTTSRVMEAARILFEHDLIGAVTLSAQSMNPTALSAAGRENIPFTQYLEIHNTFHSAGIPTYTELILGLPPESAAQFYTGIERVLQGGGHPVVYPLLLLRNTDLYRPEARVKWGLLVRKLPYQFVGSGGAMTETVIGHKELSTDEWKTAMDFVFVMALFHHVFARETIRAACRAAKIRIVDGLHRLQSALNDGQLVLPGKAPEILDNHRHTLMEPGCFDSELILGRTGAHAIPDHLHFQAAVIEVMNHLHDSSERIQTLLSDVSSIILRNRRTGSLSDQHSRDHAWVTWLSEAMRRPTQLTESVPRDALLLGVYHGAISRYLMQKRARA